SLSATQILDSTFLTFGVVSGLNATDTVSATAGLAAEDVDDPADDDNGGFDFGSTIFDNIFNKASEKYGQNHNAGGAGGEATLQVAGALAFSYTDHKVKTLITSTADMNSNDDMELTSAIVEELKITAESTGEEQPGKKDKKGNATPNTSAKNAISVAIAVGIENNSSQSIIDGGAHLDSMRALRLLSGVTYPFLTRPDEFVPTSAGEFSDRLETEGFDFINTYFDGTGGLASLFNTMARSETSADKMAIAGSINVLVFTNVAESIVHSGAHINQDPFYRPDPRFYLQPGDPGYDPAYDPAVDNDNVTHSANANNVDEHVVSIEATNYMQFMNMTGVFGFSLPSLELSSPLASGVDDVDMSFDADLTPAKGGKGGVGGAIFLQFLNNTTHAIVEQGVELYSGQQSGLNIKAEEAIMGFAFSQAGADAGKVAVGGTFSYFEQHSDTLAALQAGSIITGGRVDVYAGTLETQINWAGGVAKSKAIGAGIAIAINNTHRNTRAIIGEAADAPGTGSGGLTAPLIDVTGAVTARASVAGGLYTFTVAGAKVNASASKDTPDASAGGNAPADDSDPLDGVSLPLLFGEDPPTDDAKKKKAGTSVALAAAVAINNVTDVTHASLADYTVTSDAVDVKANNQNNIVAATGGLAFAKTDSGANTVALAGAFSYNGIDATTDAFVRDAAITLRSVDFEQIVVETADKRFSLTADTVGNIWTLAAGGAGASAGGGTGTGSGGSLAASVAGSVSINTITGHTRARMFDTTIALEAGDALNDVRVRATDSAQIFAIAGGLALSIAKGGTGKATAISAGVAIAVNTITGSTEALVESSEITWADAADGALSVQATSSGSIQAFTVAGALAAAVAKQSGSGVGAAGAGSGSVNRINADTTATVRSSTVTTAGAVTVLAKNDSKIIAGAGAIAISIGIAGNSTAAAVAIGGSFAINLIGADGDDNLVSAQIDDSDVTAGGVITVVAELLVLIFAIGIGAAGSVAASNSGSAFAVSVAGSIGVNEIHGNTSASVVKASGLTTVDGSGAGVAVTASDHSSINSTAGAAALSIASSQSTAAAVALGLSLTINDIDATTRAAVEDSELQSDGAVTVSAASDAKIDSLAFGIAVAVAVSGNASAIGVGATGAVSFNTIEKLVEATIADTAATGASSVSAVGAISVTASDASTINAIALAAAASVSGSTSAASVAVSIALALAHNTIDGSVLASIEDVGTVHTTGAVVITASNSSDITVTSLAVAVAVAISGGSSPAVAASGGGSESTNVILSRTSAYVEGGALGTQAAPVGSVTITATSTGNVKAVVLAIAASVGVGAGTTVGVAIGISVARNFIGYSQSEPAATYDNEDGTQTLTNGQTVKVTRGPRVGDVYRYIGASGTSLDLSVADFSDTTVWKQLGLTESAAGASAYVKDASIDAGGALTLTATGSQSISAVVVAAAVAIAGGGSTNVGIGGAGVFTQNKIAAVVNAYVDGDGATGIKVASAALTATDASGIKALAGAAAIAAAIGGDNSVAVALGISIALNEVGVAVDASIRNADQGLTTTAGGVSLNASSNGRPIFIFSGMTVAELDDAATRDEDDLTTTSIDEQAVDAAADAVLLATLKGKFTGANALSSNVKLVALRPGAAWQITDTTAGLATTTYFITYNGTAFQVSAPTIDATAFAASVAVSFGSTAGVSFSGAAAVAFNAVTSTANAHIDASKVTSKLGVAITAVNTSAINALVLGISAAVGASGTAGVAASIGVALSKNLVGYKLDGSASTSQVQAYVSNSTITAQGGSLTLTATGSETIAALVIAGSVAVGASGSVGVGASGAGVSVDNKIRVDVRAYVDGDSATGVTATGISASAITLSATDAASIAATAVAVSLAAAFGADGAVAVSIGVSLAHNEISNQVEAYLKNASHSLSTGTGAISIGASETAGIRAVSAAASLAVGGGGFFGGGISGAGAEASNAIYTKANAGIESSKVTSAGAITIAASDTSRIQALIISASIGVGVGAAGVGASIGVALAKNVIGGASSPSGAQAYVKTTSISSTGALSITATGSQTIDATVFAGSVAIAAGGGAVGASGAGASAVNEVTAVVQAFIDGDGATGISAASMSLSATDGSTITSFVGAVSIAASFSGSLSVSVSIGVGLAQNTISNDVQAYVANADNELKTTSGALTLTAGESATIKSTAFAASAAVAVGTLSIGLSGAGAEATNVILTKTNAHIDASVVTSAGAVTLTATDTSDIDAIVVAASIAAAVGGTAVGASIGASLARNLVGWTTGGTRTPAEVRAYLSNSSVDAAGALTATATSSQTIDAIVVSGSVAISGGTAGVGLSGAGSSTINKIAVRVEASIDGDGSA
ncbi:MAG: large repetitive protein, partial [bacterium]